MRRLSFRALTERPDISLTLLVGVVFALLGGVFVLLQWPYRAAVVSGIGGSLIAAAVVTLLSPVNNAAFREFQELGIERSFFYRSKIEDDQWCKWLRATRSQCTLLGIAHHKWCEDLSFPDALQDCLRAGVQVKFLFLDPDCPAAQQRTLEDQRANRNTIQAILDSIRFIWALKRDMPVESAKRLKMYIYRSTPSSGTSWFDDFMVVTHYLAGFANVTSPALLIKPTKTDPGVKNLYDIYMENLRKIQRSFATEIHEEWINEHFPPEAVQA